MTSLRSKARLALRETKDMAELLSAPPDQRALVVYAEDSFSHIQLGGYLDALWNEHCQGYQYVTSAPDDPILESPPAGATAWFIRDQLARFMSRLQCRVFLTTMPDLGRFHIPRPSAGRTVYAFHSLNSAHTAYRQGAFEAYDEFLCTGPHHMEELRRLRGDAPPVLSEVGYYKLDLIRAEYRERSSRDQVEDDVVLLAPSWGEANLLEANGVDLVRSLRKSGFRVIVRPHPQFFHSLYPKGTAVVASLQAEFGDDDCVQFELDINNQDSFYRSALMISDWSGAAYEYALGTFRPVLFVDTPQKIFNPAWQDLGLPSFEKMMRTEVGVIVDNSDVARVGTVAEQLIGGALIDEEDLRSLAKSIVFNLDASAQAGAAALLGSLAT